VPYLHHPATVNNLGFEGREKDFASELATSPQPRNLARRVRVRNRSGRKRKGNEGQRADGSDKKRNHRSSNARLINQAESKALEIGRRVKTTIHESPFSLSLSSDLPSGPNNSLSSHSHNANPPPIPTNLQSQPLVPTSHLIFAPLS
jgi:hypothetical protein